MSLKDSETGTRTGQDVLLQEIPDGLTVYRMVQNDPPIESDFQSYYERELVESLRRPFRAYQVFGVSTFLDRGRAERLLRTAEDRGEPAWIATMNLTAGAGLWGVYKARTTHLEVFGLPQDLLARVDHLS
jgi:hypothetical protein